MQNKQSGCSVGVVAAIVVVIALVLFNKMIIWWALGIIGLIIIAVVIMLIFVNQKDKKKKKQPVAEGITLGDVERFIKKSNIRLQAVRRGYYKLDDISMREELDTISDRCKQIFKMVKQDPKDIKIARRFLNTMLSSLERIISQSVLLFDAPSITQEGKDALTNAKEGLVLLRIATDSQINKFYQNNIMDLDVELEVLKKTLSARGLLEETIKDQDEPTQQE
ncbi:MAG: 5-bromo-4-chloroindolyl phosphate hydrolysis family protein [Clostridiales bacterium]|nr:5-bromo-4-chloroindolyl phosphate hydrolysis family protein [Clostridiales bacterium]